MSIASFMKEKFNDYPATTVCVLSTVAFVGIALVLKKTNSSELLLELGKDKVAHMKATGDAVLYVTDIGDILVSVVP